MRLKSFISFILFTTVIYANTCPKWFPLPTNDGLVVVIHIYDESITEPDLDCDGVFILQCLWYVDKTNIQYLTSSNILY